MKKENIILIQGRLSAPKFLSCSPINSWKEKKGFRTASLHHQASIFIQKSLANLHEFHCWPKLILPPSILPTAITSHIATVTYITHRSCLPPPPVAVSQHLCISWVCKNPRKNIQTAQEPTTLTQEKNCRSTNTNMIQVRKRATNDECFRKMER